MRFNADFYYSKYLDQQTFSQQLDADGVNWFREVNAGTARIWGLEGELQAEPIENLRFDGSFGYLNYLAASPTAAIRCCYRVTSAAGRPAIHRARRSTRRTGCAVQHGCGRRRLMPRLDLTYQSTIYFAANNGCFGAGSPAGCGQTDNQGGYTLLNGRITCETGSKKWTASLWGRNLTDKEYFYGKLSLITFFGREQGNPAPPREYGLTVQRKF